MMITTLRHECFSELACRSDANGNWQGEPARNSAARITDHPDSANAQLGRPNVRKKVLIVDDSPDLVDLWSYVIEELQCCDVLTARDGAQAVAIAIDEKPDLILMDLAMPIMDGYEATRRILAEPGLTETPVVAVSAHDKAYSADRSIKAGCREFVGKPVAPERLEAIILKYLKLN